MEMENENGLGDRIRDSEAPPVQEEKKPSEIVLERDLLSVPYRPLSEVWSKLLSLISTVTEGTGFQHAEEAAEELGLIGRHVQTLIALRAVESLEICLGRLRMAIRLHEDPSAREDASAPVEEVLKQAGECERLRISLVLRPTESGVVRRIAELLGSAEFGAISLEVREKEGEGE